MAEGLIGAALEARGLGQRVAVRSSGTWAVDGVPASPHAVTVLRRRGVDIAGHRSRELDAELIATSDLVLVMTAGHAEAILAEFPEAHGKVLRFSALAGGDWDIADPVGGSVEDYAATADELARLIEAGWAIIAGDGATG